MYRQNEFAEVTSPNVPAHEAIGDLLAATHRNLAICSRVTALLGQKYLLVPSTRHPPVGAPPGHDAASARRST
jgi:hypothetical protein